MSEVEGIKVVEPTGEGWDNCGSEASAVKGAIKESVWVALGALVVYYLTSMPYIGFGDTAILVSAIERGNFVSHVNNHPLTVIIGWIFSSLSSAEPSSSANLVSVLFGALTIALLCIAVRLAGVSRFVSYLVAATATVMHSMWWHSTIIENYAVSAALVMATYGALFHFDRSRAPHALYLACLLAGFSVFNHVQNGFLCIGVAVAGLLFVLSSRQVKALISCALMALLGLLPWLGLVVRDAMQSGSFSVTLRDAFVGKFEGTFFSATAYSMVCDTLYIVWLQSPLFLLPVTAAVGVYVVFFSDNRAGNTTFWGLFTRRPGACGALVHMILTFVVFSGYPTWDRFAFLLPALMGGAVFSGIGIEALRSRALSTYTVVTWCGLTVLSCPVLYASFSTLAKDPQSFWHKRYNNNYSANLYDQARFVANPMRIGYTELEEFARLLETSLPPNSYFLDDDSRTYYTLADYYQRYRNFRRDIQILLVNAWGFSDWGLDAEKLTKLMEDAYYSGKPFFAASIHRPYNTFFAKAKERFPVSFSPFPIGKGRWVYRLQTLPETLGSKRKILTQAVNAGRVTPGRLLAASGEINVTLSSVLFASFDRATQQPMETFGPQWSKDDHLLLVSSQAGAQVEFALFQSEPLARNITLIATAASDYGIIEVALNGRPLGRFDLYSPVVDTKQLSLGNLPFTAEGDILSLRVVGKNNLSSGYLVGVDSIQYK